MDDLSFVWVWVGILRPVGIWGHLQGKSICTDITNSVRWWWLLDQAWIQGFFLGDRKPPLRLSAILCLRVDLPRALQQFGSAPEIPVRTPPPPSECTKHPLLNPGSAPDWWWKLGGNRYTIRQHYMIYRECKAVLRLKRRENNYVHIPTFGEKAEIRWLLIHTYVIRKACLKGNGREHISYDTIRVVNCEWLQGCIDLYSGFSVPIQRRDHLLYLIQNKCRKWLSRIFVKLGGLL